MNADKSPPELNATPATNTGSKKPPLVSNGHLSDGSLLRKKIIVVMKIIASVITLSIFTYLGSQIVYLYSPLTDAPNARPAHLTTFESPTLNLIEVQFGDLPIGLNRMQIKGDKQTALDQLELLCQKATARCKIPISPPSKTESALLGSLESNADITDADIIVCRLKSINPIVVGIKNSIQSDKQNNHNRNSNPRILAWGFAIKDKKDTWDLRVLTKSSTLVGGGSQPFTIDLPPGSQKILQMQADHGDLVLAFKNNQTIAAQMDFFDIFFFERKWVKESQWQTTPNGQEIRYHKTAITGQRKTAEIHLQRSAENDNDIHYSSWGLISTTSKQPPK